MRARIFLICSLFLVFGSCMDQDVIDYNYNTCQVDDPVKDLPWLKTYIAELENDRNEIYPYLYISEASYNNQTVFIFGNCCPNCNSVIPVRDCDGNVLFNFSEEGREKSLINQDVIWKAYNCQCNFL